LVCSSAQDFLDAAADIPLLLVVVVVTAAVAGREGNFSCPRDVSLTYKTTAFVFVNINGDMIAEKTKNLNKKKTRIFVCARRLF